MEMEAEGVLVRVAKPFDPRNWNVGDEVRIPAGERLDSLVKNGDIQLLEAIPAKEEPKTEAKGVVGETLATVEIIETFGQKMARIRAEKKAAREVKK